MSSVCIVLDESMKVVATHPPLGTKLGDTVFGGFAPPPGKRYSRVEVSEAEALRQPQEDVSAYHARLSAHIKARPELKPVPLEPPRFRTRV